MSGCNEPVGTTRREPWRRATPTPADWSRLSSWTSSVRSPAPRKHALVVLRRPPTEGRDADRRGLPPSYGPAEVALLRVSWATADGVCSRRLASFLPEQLEQLRLWHLLQHVSPRQSNASRT